MDRLSLQILVFILWLGVPRIADARTWYVTVDGTGDAPYIWAALDSAVAYDTVLVAAGTYVVGRLIMANGVTLLSETGPLETKFVPDEAARPSGAISCNNLSLRTEVSGFWIDGFRFGSMGSGAISVVLCQSLFITHNIFTNNHGSAVAIDASFTNGVFLTFNTFVGNGLAIDNHAGGNCVHNIIWDRANGLDIFLTVCNDLLDINDVQGVVQTFNFSADPLFCGGAGAQAFLLQADSPCVPANSPILCPERLGALPAGCTGVPVEKRTWGGIKSIFKR